LYCKEVGSLGNDGRVAHAIASGDYRRPINRARARARISIFITTENKTRQRWDVRSVDGLFLLVYRVRCRICSRVAAANVDSGRQTEREREGGGEGESRTRCRARHREQRAGNTRAAFVQPRSNIKSSPLAIESIIIRANSFCEIRNRPRK